jgi:pyruvate/2-oxoglutarate dehydrogenase complex dihydrolipoamide dehydrogenase (E3) component
MALHDAQTANSRHQNIRNCVGIAGGGIARGTPATLSEALSHLSKLTLSRRNINLRILIVGGAGYIGSHTARVLRRHGHEVILYDNLSTGHRESAEGFALVVGDIGDRQMLVSIMPRVEAVIHLAALAYVGESVAILRH